jgi:DNA-binding CsgD family transcriptional regulator
MPRFVVVEEGDTAAVDAATADLTAGGATVLPGWQVTAGSAATVCVGRVTNVDDAARAVLAAVRGADLVVAAAAPREVIDQLCDDLRRLGEVDHRVGGPAAPTLTGEQRDLLARLLAGATLGDAARALHISRRTADRRLAAARTALGARTTAEALRAAAELGVRPAG